MSAAPGGGGVATGPAGGSAVIGPHPFGTIVGVTTRAVLSRRRTLLVLLFVAAPVLLALLARAVGATSDVSVLITDQPLHPGDTVAFAIDYDALVRAMTSPFVAKEFITRTRPGISTGDS